jgi:hypothetical protein
MATQQIVENYSGLQSDLYFALEHIITVQVSLQESQEAKKMVENRAASREQEQDKILAKVLKSEMTIRQLKSQLVTAAIFADELDIAKSKNQKLERDLRKAIKKITKIKLLVPSIHSLLTMLQTSVHLRDTVINTLEKQRDHALDNLEISANQLNLLSVLTQEMNIGVKKQHEQAGKIEALSSLMHAGKINIKNICSGIKQQQRQYDIDIATIQKQYHDMLIELDRKKCELQMKNRVDSPRKASELIAERLETELEATCHRLKNTFNRMDEIERENQELKNTIKIHDLETDQRISNYLTDQSKQLAFSYLKGCYLTFLITFFCRNITSKRIPETMNVTTSKMTCLFIPMEYL